MIISKYTLISHARARTFTHMYTPIHTYTHTRSKRRANKQRALHKDCQRRQGCCWRRFAGRPASQPASQPAASSSLLTLWLGSNHASMSGCRCQPEGSFPSSAILNFCFLTRQIGFHVCFLSHIKNFPFPYISSFLFFISSTSFSL